MQSNNLGFTKHNHGRCIEKNLKVAEAFCAKNNLRFTPSRKRVFEILLEEHRALGAYDILDVLQAEGVRAQPPVVYRALDFLILHGWVHKIERLNAYLACSSPDHRSEAHSFLICTSCQSISEFHLPIKAIKQMAELNETQFQLSNLTFEAEGLCPQCQ